MKMCHKALFSGLLFLIAFQAEAHNCVAGKNEMSFHFKSLSIIKTLEIISNFSDRDLIIKTDRSLKVPLHYNCVGWRKIVEDLSRKHNLKIDINLNSIVFRE